MCCPLIKHYIKNFYIKKIQKINIYIFLKWHQSIAEEEKA